MENGKTAKAEKNNGEKSLLNMLEGDDISAQLLRRHSAALAKLESNGFLIDRVMIMGKPWPELLRASFRLSGQEMTKLGKLAEIQGLSSFKVFPLGRIQINALKVDLDFSNRVVRG